MQVSYSSYDYTSTSVKFSMQTTSGARDQADREVTTSDPAAVFTPSKDAASNASVIEPMKASLQSSQQKLFDLVNDLLSKQGMTARLGQGTWKILAEGNFQVDAETKAAAQASISEDGEWGVKKTSQRLLSFAKALVGGDPSKAGMMRDAVIKGFEAAKKAWGGELPEISQRTYDAVMKLFDEWENGGETEQETPASSASGMSISIEYQYTRVSSRSVSVTTSAGDKDWLEGSGVLSDVSDPISLHGMNLNAAWCMNEKVSVTVSIGREAKPEQAAPGHDGFASREEQDFGGYDRRGHHVGRGTRPERPARQEREISLDFFKPMRTNGSSFRLGGQDIPLHEDGTVTVGFSDGTLRRARVNQQALDRLVQED